MNRFLLIALTAGLFSPAFAEVDPKVHKMCLQAQDYLGCVKAQTTNSTDIPSLRVIQGKTELTGNSCPNLHAYSGSGYCTRIICNGNRFRSHPDLRYKKMEMCTIIHGRLGRTIFKSSSGS